MIEAPIVARLPPVSSANSEVFRFVPALAVTVPTTVALRFAAVACAAVTVPALTLTIRFLLPSSRIRSQVVPLKPYSHTFCVPFVELVATVSDAFDAAPPEHPTVQFTSRLFEASSVRGCKNPDELFLPAEGDAVDGNATPIVADTPPVPPVTGQGADGDAGTDWPELLRQYKSTSMAWLLCGANTTVSKITVTTRNSRISIHHHGFHGAANDTEYVTPYHTMAPRGQGSLR